MKVHAPSTHPRYLSNFYRDLLVSGVEKGIVSHQGLIAHGRGETFDYLIGEKTRKFAKDAIKAAAAVLIVAKHPVISVNGNSAILAPAELVKLSKIVGAKLEVNIFHRSKIRERTIARYLKKHGANEILFPNSSELHGIDSNRKKISRQGQAKADVVFVPLEDGDRTEALIKMGKHVITVDLNPLSRTAQCATITIVDNIIRALPLLIKEVINLKGNSKNKLKRLISGYDNTTVLRKALITINKTLTKPFSPGGKT